MLKDILDQVLPVLTTTIVAVLVVIIKAIGNKIGDYYKVKEIEVLHTIEANKYQETISKAWEAWQIVDEHFRITEFVGDVIKAKQDLFAEVLLKKIPGLTQAEIETLRQTIAGEVNSGKTAINNTLNKITN